MALPTQQALEAMTRAQLVITYDALQPTYPQQLPPRATHGRGNYSVNLKAAMLALLAPPQQQLQIQALQPLDGNLQILNPIQQQPQQPRANIAAFRFTE